MPPFGVTTAKNHSPVRLTLHGIWGTVYANDLPAMNSLLEAHILSKNLGLASGVFSPANGFLPALFVDEQSTDRDQKRQICCEREDFPSCHAFE